MTTSTSEFGKWRAKLWPVHTFELKKVVPMVLMFFLILFNYTILRDTKDTLVVTAAHGSSVIPFLKLWGVLPAAVLFMLGYSKLSNKLSKPALFYATIVPFLVFFGLFATVFYPFREALHPTAFCDHMQAVLPSAFKGVIDVVRNWTFSVFYVMSELWGSVALSLLFWGFANDINKKSEALRYYTVFAMFANVSLICSGRFIQWASKARASIVAADPWQVSLNYMMSLVVIGGIAIIGIYYWMNKNVLTDKRFYNPAEPKQGKKSKPKLSIKDSMKYILSSKYLGCLAILTLSYGLCINLVEVVWKNQIHLQYPNYNDYSAFMGGFSEKTGYVTILLTFFLGGTVIRRFGWGKTAMITPTILLITGAAFFSFILFRDTMVGMIATLGTSPLMLAVAFGAAQNIASKSSKYTFFDPTKEMAYIPLDQEQKVKGKAAVDVVGARMGKSGGSLLVIFLLSVSGGVVENITPYAAGIMIAVIAAWLLAARSLNKQFTTLSAQREEEEKAAEAELEAEQAKQPEAELETSGA